MKVHIFEILSCQNHTHAIYSTFSGHSRDHKRLCCLCCKSGPISAVITSNRAGYVPGEMIGFNAEVDNLSNRNMKVAIKCHVVL